MRATGTALVEAALAHAVGKWWCQRALQRSYRSPAMAGSYGSSSRESRLALPPTAVMLLLTEYSPAKRGR